VQVQVLGLEEGENDGRGNSRPGGPRYVDATEVGGKVKVSTTATNMTFGTFFSGLGSVWEQQQQAGNGGGGGGGLRQLVVRTRIADEGGEWELC
jgi:hypothetical protein